MEESHLELGFAEECDAKWLVNRYFPSKIGGKPAWLHLSALPLPHMLLCQKCNNPKIFMCQIYAPFEDIHNFHRMLYVFVCRTQSCNQANDASNFTVLRSQLSLKNDFYSSEGPDEDGEALPVLEPINNKLCEICGNLGYSICSSCKKVHYCGVAHQRLHWPYHKKICDPSCTNETLKKQSLDNESSLKALLFPEWEIVLDTCNSDKNEEKINLQATNEENQMKEYELLKSEGRTGELDDIPMTEFEKYICDTSNINDKYFRRFRKKCSKHPDQIIRYKRKAEPLWITDVKTSIAKQLTQIPKCELCNSDRHFEFQIMPQMLNYLKDTNLDWGVLAIYTCSMSCPLPINQGYVNELIIKQDINT